MRNGVQLITYPNSLGPNLGSLQRVLNSDFQNAFTGVHLLPFFPSSGDRGFAPIDYSRVDPNYGSWNDIRALTEEYDLTADFMLNHLSRRSPQFQDFIEKGADSPWASLFIRLNDLFPEGEFPKDVLDKIYTRKPKAPDTEICHPDGTREKVWSSFSEEQVDLDINSAVGKAFVEDTVRFLLDQGFAMLRLDAFAYACKRPGSSCFFIEPDVWELLDGIRRIAEVYGAELLPEIHEHYSIQLKLAKRGYRSYDFALPMLLLHAIFSRDASRLKAWLKICPREHITTLDTHDGIGVVDVADLLSPRETSFTVDQLYSRGSNIHRRYSSAEYGNLDIYQINCTYYSALGEDDERYLLARAVQFFAPGIPQVYYVGALSGVNDTALVEASRQGRDINRHSYSEDEVRREMKRSVNRRLRRLMRFRSAAACFHGSFQLLESDSRKIRILREGVDGSAAELEADLESFSCNIRHKGADGTVSVWHP